MPSNILSKSKYMLGLQCPTLLWVAVNEPDRIPEVDEATQHRFDQGHLVGEFVKQLFPEGIECFDDDFNKCIENTKEALVKRKPLFEAAIQVDNIYSRADVLFPVGKDEWDVIEVKSSTKVKDEHYQDVSFQKYCYKQFGLKIRKCYLMHLNNEYVRKGAIDPKQLFVKEDITEEVDSISGVKERIDAMFEIISGKKCPNVCINPNCFSPYTCALEDECWGNIPSESVFELYRGGKKKYELYESGTVLMKEILGGYKLTSNQEIQKECAKTGEPYVDDEKIKEFIDSLEYPLYYLDFEGFSTAIPLFDDSRPYQQISFQFSLHVVDKKGIKHYGFLAEGNKDPRKEFLMELKKVLGDKGSIIVYNQVYEIGRLKELAEVFSEEEWVDGVIGRVVDLLMPFRKFYYYNPKQKGSCSIKKVLPAVTGKDYGDLDIQDGETAGVEFLRITQGDEEGKLPPEKEIKKVRQNLEKYCGLDTEGMVWIVEELSKI